MYFFLIVPGSSKNLQSLLIVIFHVLNNNLFFTGLVSFFVSHKDSYIFFLDFLLKLNLSYELFKSYPGIFFSSRTNLDSSKNT